ncbi:MAG: hypothetical protein ABSE93_15465 [Terriglobia bacterium]|jgi:hypothetical protein
MKMIEAVKMPQMRHARILPQPQAASACARPADVCATPRIALWPSIVYCCWLIKEHEFEGKAAESLKNETLGYLPRYVGVE